VVIAVGIAAVLTTWVGLAYVCDSLCRRQINRPKAKHVPEPLVSSTARVAAYVRDESEIEAEVLGRINTP
jgi:hypothetical protein